MFGAGDPADDRQLGDQGVEGDLLVDRRRRFVTRGAVEVDQGGDEQPDVAVCLGQLRHHAMARLGDQLQSVAEPPSHRSQGGGLPAQVVDDPFLTCIRCEVWVFPGAQPLVELRKLLRRGVGDERSDRVFGVADRLLPPVFGLPVGGHRTLDREVLHKAGVELLVGQDLVRLVPGRTLQPSFTRSAVERLPDQHQQRGGFLRAGGSRARHQVEGARQHAGQQRWGGQSALQEPVDGDVLGVEDVAVAVHDDS